MHSRSSGLCSNISKTKNENESKRKTELRGRFIRPICISNLLEYFYALFFKLRV